MSAILKSPVTGEALKPDANGCLQDVDGRCWPVVDGIPYLRVGRDDLAAEATGRLRAGDREGALVVLLADQDDWWTGSAPDEAALRDLVRRRETLTLRDAMGRLAFDRVGDYFAHRWSDPTFLAGLALLEAYWRPTRRAFELACGIGHYGRELARRGVAVTGGDVVFAKLWLARHWVVPAETRLICFDAAAPWPLMDAQFDLAFCHDAFYFLEPKAEILARLRALAEPAGRVAISHIHNSGADNLSAGRAVSAVDLARLFPRAAIFDDDELTRALIEARPPQPAALSRLERVEAFSLEDDAREAVPRAPAAGLAVPPEDAELRVNPLYVETPSGCEVAWPSVRYGAEYGPRCTYPLVLDSRPRTSSVESQGGRVPLSMPPEEAVRRRVLVDLPERW